MMLITNHKRNKIDNSYSKPQVYNGWREVVRHRTANRYKYSNNENELISDEEMNKHWRNIFSLPSLACNFFTKEEVLRKPIHESPTAQLITLGIQDEGSTLHRLIGLEYDILPMIFEYCGPSFLDSIKLTIPSHLLGRICGGPMCCFTNFSGYYGEYVRADDLPLTSRGSNEYVSFASVATLNFPKAQGINVNMMPFILGDIESLPKRLRCYFDSIMKCPIDEVEYGKVCYLTVREGFDSSTMGENEYQNRKGLHVGSPELKSNKLSSFSPGEEHFEGRGVFFTPDRFEGGIYMASSIDDNIVVYDALVDTNGRDIIDQHGRCDHIRPWIGDGVQLKAGELIWMNDRTPYEEVNPFQGVYTQFFRLVTSGITHWFEKKSTANPAVPVPENVIIV